MRTIVTLIVLVLIFWTSQVVSLFLGIQTGALCFLLLLGMFIWNGIVNVPADPPHKAMLVFLGKRQDVILDEGWNWLPFSGFIFNLILIKVEKTTDNFEPQEVRTPDNALLEVRTAATWTPGIDGEPDSYKTFLNSGGPDGVKKILHNAVEDRTKTWARSNKEGPSTWEEAQATKDDAHEVLVKAIMRENLEPINSPVPTSTWMRFFDEPQSAPTIFDANPRNGWANRNPQEKEEWDWNGLRDYFNSLRTDEQTRIEVAVKNRRRIVRELREGNGSFPIRSLGITILMFVVNDIKAKGAAAEFADTAEKERLQREAETVEVEHVAKIAETIRKAHPDLSSEKALETVQVERAKVRKQIFQINGAQTALGNDLVAVAASGGLGGMNTTNTGGQQSRPQSEIQSSSPPAQKNQPKPPKKELTDEEIEKELDL